MTSLLGLDGNKCSLRELEVEHISLLERVFVLSLLTRKIPRLVEEY